MSASNVSKTASDGLGNTFPADMAFESVSQTFVPANYLKEPVGETLVTPAQDGIDGVGITPPTGALGIRGWLSGVYKLLSNPLAVTGAFWQSTQPVSLSSLPTVGGILGVMNMNGAQIANIPVVTASSYTSGFVLGGIQAFSPILNPNFIGKLQSITLRFKGSVQSIAFDVSIFTTLPTGTYADHGAPVIASTDTNFLIGTYTLPTTAAKSKLGTQTVYNLDGINKKIVGASQGLWAVVTSEAALTNNLASTSDMSLVLAVDW